MQAFMNTLLGVLLLGLMHSVDAFWRMSCGRIQLGRVDPIISPGGVSGHAHTISGPINLNTTSTYQSLQAAYCTSCGIQADKSGYWSPQLYYRYRNGSFTEVPNGGTVVYYLSRGDAELSMVPFPPGYRILAGDSAARSYDSTTMTYGGNATKKYQNRPVADRVSFACLNYDNPTPETPRLANMNCPGGLRAQVHLPSCWDGVNLYKSDQSHAAYMNGIDTGVCPPTHPKVIPHLFFEVIYSVNNVGQEKGGYFVFANGDTTGYGFHADFLNGWDQKVLADSIQQCMGTGRAINDGDIQKCPPLNQSFDPFFDKNCPEQPPIINETVTGLLKVLPGCNPPTGGPLRAAQNICPVQPGLNAVQNTDNIVRKRPQPGGLVGDFQYLGCAFDQGVPKTLQGGFYQAQNNLTIEQCTSYCRKNGYAYAGVENGYQCSCGNAFQNPIQDAGVCAGQSLIVCNGNSLEYCGGQNLVHLYNDTKTTVQVRGLPQPGQTKINVPTGGQATYAGCYSEPSNGRALTGTSFQNQTGMTNEICAAFCNKGGYILAGTEYATECYCGNSIATSPVAQGNCTAICKGDSTQFCGNGGKMSLWTLTGNISTTAPSNTAGSGSGSASSSTPSPVPVASGIAYLNCYSDTTNPRALAADFSDSTSQSVDSCAQRAQTLNYKYFGLEYGSQCLIGDVLAATSTLLAATKCNVVCKGNARQYCGGSQAMNVYNNTLYTPRIPPTVALPAQAASFTYKGCYSKGSGAALAGGSLTSDATISVDSCAALCLSKGYSWMGLEYGQECSCNNAGPTNGATLSAGGDNDCSMPCAGKRTQNCGNSGKVQIYQKAVGGNSRIVQGNRKRGFVRV